MAKSKKQQMMDEMEAASTAQAEQNAGEYPAEAAEQQAAPMMPPGQPNAGQDLVHHALGLVGAMTGKKMGMPLPQSAPIDPAAPVLDPTKVQKFQQGFNRSK